MKSINNRVSFTVILGLLVSVAAVAQVIVPCEHWVPLHRRGDIVRGRYGETVVPCKHLAPLHPRGDIRQREPSSPRTESAPPSPRSRQQALNSPSSSPRQSSPSPAPARSSGGNARPSGELGYASFSHGGFSTEPEDRLPAEEQPFLSIWDFIQEQARDSDQVMPAEPDLSAAAETAPEQITVEDVSVSEKNGNATTLVGEKKPRVWLHLKSYLVSLRQASQP